MDKLALPFYGEKHNIQPTMKKTAVFALSLIAVMLVGVSCKKKCDLPEEDTYSGIIIHEVNDKNVVIYPESGELTGNFIDYHLDANHSYSPGYEISLDGGVTRISLNTAEYNILANPCVIACDAAIARDVVYDAANDFYTYTVTVTECASTCSEERLIENYVLIPAIDPASTVIFNVVYN